MATYQSNRTDWFKMAGSVLAILAILSTGAWTLGTAGFRLAERLAAVETKTERLPVIEAKIDRLMERQGIPAHGPATTAQVAR